MDRREVAKVPSIMIDWQSTVAIVPARGGSKRLPGKNIRPLAGKVLLDYTAEFLAAGAPEMPCLLTTDDTQIAEQGKRLGWLVPFLRPAPLASDQASTEDAVLHALDWYAENHGEPKYLMVLQPTSPFRVPSCLSEAFECLDRKPIADAVVGMMSVDEPAAGAVVVRSDGLINPISCSGIKNEGGSYARPNGAMYLVRTDVFRNVKSLYPPKTRALLMSAAQSLDIDTAEDWRAAEKHLETVSTSQRISIQAC